MPERRMPSAPPPLDLPSLEPNTEPKRSQATETKKQNVRSDREAAILGIFQLGCLPLIGMAQAAEKADRKEAALALQADVAAVAKHSPDIATACVALAESDKRFAKVLDRIIDVGPYGVLVSCVFSFGAQIATNHGIKGLDSLTVPRDELIASVAGENVASRNGNSA